MTEFDVLPFLYPLPSGELGFDGIASREARIDAWVAWATLSAMAEVKAISISLRDGTPLGNVRITPSALHEDTRDAWHEALRASPANDLMA